MKCKSPLKMRGFFISLLSYVASNVIVAYYSPVVRFVVI